MKHDEIMDRLGADNWQMVVNEFGGMTTNQIEAELSTMFPTEADANAELAQAITDRIARSAAAAALGSAKSERKAASSRENGKLGGRPRKA